MRTIAIVNQKGGCGKTTTAINLAALYAKRGLRTLLVDMDPQSHCAAGLGVPEARIEYSIGDALLAEHDASFKPSALVWEVARNLHLAPSTVMLSALEAPGGGLHQMPDKDRRLESLLTLMAPNYDRCLIDCPPTIGLLTYNALRACRETLIPVETGFFSLRGAEKQWNTIHRLISHINRPIACHLLPTLHKPDSQLACNILAALRRQFAGQIMPIVIHEHEALREAASFGQPVLEYAPESSACRDFEWLADWLEEHHAQPIVEVEVLPHSGFAPARVGNDMPRPSGDTETGAGNTRAAELARRVSVLAGRAALHKCGPAVTTEHTENTEQRFESTPQSAIHNPASVISVGVDETTKRLSEEPIALAEPIVTPPQPAPVIIDLHPRTPPDLTHIYGVRRTSQGVLFVQPAHLGQAISVAGDFNLWSSSTHRLRYDEQAGVFQAVFPLPPGAHGYRLVVDGNWILDPHNSNVHLNSYGEPNSVIVVPG